MFEIGSTLRQARERRRLGLDQVEAETKIRARYLRALEDDQFDLLPGPAYVKGFLRTYAEYLGLDGTLFVDEYNSRFSDPFRDEEVIFPRRRSHPPRDRRGRRESNVVLIALAGIVAVAVLVAVAFMYPTDRPPGGVETLPTESSAPTTTAAATDAIDPPGNPVARETEEAAEAAEREQSTAAETTPPPTKRKRVYLTVIVTAGESWVSVYPNVEGTGNAAFTNTLDATSESTARTRKFNSRKGYLVEIGRPDNVELLINGKRWTAGSVSRVIIRPSGEVEPQT